MNAKEAVEKTAALAMSWFEKALEIRIVQHFLCIVIYFDIATFFLKKKPLLQVTWVDINQTEPGIGLLLLLGYFVLIGYVLRVGYFLLTFTLGWMNSFIPSDKTQYADIRGMVSERDVRQRAYDTKDNEPIRMLETHQEKCKQDRKEVHELAYLSFCVLVLGLYSFYFLPGATVALGHRWLVDAIGAKLISLCLMILLFPCPVLIWLDSTDDFERDRYLKHDPLYADLIAEKSKNAQ